jgi:hypothetical protein
MDVRQLLKQNFDKALEMPTKYRINHASDLVDPVFADYVALRLAVYHHFDYHPRRRVNKEAFEYMLESACNLSGTPARLNHKRGGDKPDIYLDFRNRLADPYSLKTESEDNFRDKVFIPKLRHCNWIKDAKDVDELWDRMQEKIVRHAQSYAGIFILRSYPRSDSEMQYDLIEIPGGFFQAALTKAKKEDIRPAGKGYRLDIEENGSRLMQLHFDPTGPRVQVDHLSIDRCLVHAFWVIPL